MALDSTVFIQGEDLTPLDSGGAASLSRTRTQNQEKHGLNGEGLENQPGGGDDNPGAPQYDDFGLRPNYDGDGYLDINGDAGDKLQFSFDAVPGTYEITLRIANGSAPRPISLTTDNGTTASQPTLTGEWYDWELRTFTVTVDGDGQDTVQTHNVTISTDESNGPNIDAIAVADVGTPVSWFAPVIETDTLSMQENLTLVGAVVADDLDNQDLSFSITGGNDEGKFDITPDGTLSFKEAPDFEAPGSVGGTNDYTVEVSVTDGAETTVKAITVSVTDDPELVMPVIDQILVQGESGIITDTAAVGPTAHRIQGEPGSVENGAKDNAGNTLPPNANFDTFGMRTGYTGNGYTDFGGSVGETVTWTVNVDEAGLYDLNFRYATSSLRPMDLIVNGTTADDQVPFNGTTFDATYYVLDAPLGIELNAGDNTIALRIPAPVSGNPTGPNIESLVVTSVGVAADFSAPVFEALIGDLSIDENGTGVLATVAATDPTETAETVTYALEGADSGLFDINGAGEITFAAAPDFEAPGDVGGDNTYDLVVAASAGGTTIRQNVAIAVRNVDEPLSAVTLSARADIAENDPGIVVADIVLDDPDTDYELASFSITGDPDGQFEVAGNATDGFVLKLIDGAELDHEAASQPMLSVSVAGISSETITLAPTNDTSDDVTPNTAPTAGAGTADTEFGAAVVIPLVDLIDDAEDAGEPTITAATSPDGTVVIDNGTHSLIFTPNAGFSGAATISYTVEDSEGLTADSAVTVTVAGEVVPFETIVLQGEDFEYESFNQPGDTNPNTIRTATGAWEQPGAPNNEATTGFNGNANTVEFNGTGNRPGYTGTGYLDINNASGEPTGPQASFVFDAPAGTYDLTVRYANGSGSQSRPLSLTVEGVKETIADTRTNVDGVANTGWYTWDTAVLTFAVTGDGPHTVVIGQESGGGSANIDAIAVSANGTPAVFPAVDLTADADANLAVAQEGNSVETDNLAATVIRVSGVDSDAQFFQAKVGNGPFVNVTPTDDGDDKLITLDLTGTEPGSVDVIVRVFDTTGNAIDTAPAAITVVANVDDPTTVSLTAVDVTENVPGAVVANILIEDPDTDLSGLTVADFTLSDDVNFRVIEEAGQFRLALADTVSLDFEADVQPSVTVSVNGSAAVGFAPKPLDDTTDNNTAPTATEGSKTTAFETAVVIDLADVIDDAQDADGDLTVVASSGEGTVDVTDQTLTFTPNAGFSGPATISYTVTDTGGLSATSTYTVEVATAVPPTITLGALTFDENVDGAVVADITVTNANPEAGDFTLDNADFRVTGTPGALQLALAVGVKLDFEPGNFPSVTLSLGAVSADLFTATPEDAEDAAVITLTPQPFDENVDGAVVASIAVSDQDGDTYTFDQFTTDDARFEVVDQDGLKLKLKVGESLDAEGVIPTVTVSVGGGSADIVATPENVAEPRVLTFGALSVYDGNQDKPGQGGSAVVSADGSSVSLDGNFWKRAAVDPVTITDDTVLRVTIDVRNTSEIVAIGFDGDNDGFDGDKNLYHLSGTQTFSPLVDLRNTGTVNGDGTITFDIPLGRQSGQTFSSVVLINDDDDFRAAQGGGRGHVVFSGLEIIEPVVEVGNSAPRVVGGGIADQAVDERTSVEIDLPFVDDDGDTITYSYGATLSGEAVDLGLQISDGTLSGNLGATAPGTYTVTVTADDGQGGVTDEVFVLTVVDVNEAPIADTGAAFEPFFGAVGQEIAPINLSQFAAAFSDPDGDTLSYVVTGLPAGLRIEEDVILGTPTAAGDGTFSVAVSDGEFTSQPVEIGLLIDTPEPVTEFSIEAEDFTGLGASAFFATGQAGASGDQLIRVNSNQSATVTTQLAANGVTEGFYKVQIVIYDETDGTASYALSIDGTQLSADGATFDDAGAFTNPSSNRGDAGQVGNRKIISFEQVVFVDANSVLTLSGQADGELLRTDRVIFTRTEQPNLAPEAAVLTGEPVLENTEGAVAGTLAAVDPDGDDAAVTFSVDAASIFEVDGTTLKLKAGESLDFEAGATVAVDVTATDALGSTSVTTLTIAIADVDEAPEAATLTPATVDENVAGAVIGQLAAVDPEGEAITFTVTDPRFAVSATGELTLADGVALNFEEGDTVTVEVTADDGVNQTVGNVDVTVGDVNDAPTLADGAAIAPVSADFGAGATVDLTPLGASDEDGDTLSYGVRGAGTDPLPAGFSVIGTDLVVAATVAAGTYTVEVFANDGTLDSESVSVTVTVGEPGPFEPIVLEAEGFTLIADGNSDPSDDNLIRTETQNWERDGSSLNPEPNDTSPNPGGDEFNAIGLRPGYTGTGYLDINGTDQGPQATFDFTAPAGTYDLTFRIANGSSNARPMGIEIDGQTFEFSDTRTGEFYLWETRTVTVTLTEGGSHTVVISQNNTAGAPNFDNVTITDASAVPDTSADADEFPLNLDGPVAGSTLNATAAASINFQVAGRDTDIVKVELSFDGGTSRSDVTLLLDADGDFVFDGTALPDGATTATVIVTDATGNEATDTLSFNIDRGTAPVAPITIQAEDETLVTVTDVGVPNAGNGTGNGPTNVTREVNAANVDGFGNYRGGAVGEAYIDFGAEAGDAISFDVAAPRTGTYDVTFRYANADGSGANRPLDMSVNGSAATAVPFPNTGSGDAGWENWTDFTVEVELTAGSNTVSLTIPAGAVAGPNIDQATFTFKDGDVTPPAGDAEVFEQVVKINFEAPTSGNGNFNAPAGYTTPEGFESDTGAAYGDRGNGFTYGWVDVDDANGTVTGTPAAQPTESARYKNNVTEASDLQKTYLHFDYPGTADGDRERAWEMEVENGTYELTVAIGDTAGQYDSNYVLNVEGTQFGNDFVPVNLARQQVTGGAYDSAQDGEGFRSTLYTGIVQVTDGRLTIDGIDGANVEIQWLDLDRIPDLTPGDGRTADLDYSKFVAAVAASQEDGQVTIEIDEDGTVPLGIDPTSSLVIGVQLQAIDHRGPAITAVDGIKLVETLTGIEVAINVQITGGADGLTIKPLADLKEFTSYTLLMEDVLDLGNLNDSALPQRQFQDYSTTFVTGEAPVDVPREVAFTDTLVLDGGVAYTSIEIGPDGKLYTASITGDINRWDLNADGTIDQSSNEILSLGHFKDGGRSIIGMAFDPEDPNVIWVTDNAPVPRTGKADQTPEFSGQISKITLGANGSFADAEAETYITGLPRSGGDHVTNSIEFRANPDAGDPGEPNFLLYFTQGSNSAAGRPDNSWGFRPERLLNAAVLEVDPSKTAPDGGFDVQTEPWNDGQNPTFRTPDPFNADGTFDGFYNPYADDAVLKIYGEGVRNAYDLVWHSNGNLYLPTNGTARGGNTLDNPNTAINEELSGLDKQFDYLFQVQEGGYYGHPNSLLGNYVVNGGAGGPDNIYGSDNSANTPDDGNEYANGVVADANYDRDGSYSLGFNKSPNGATEYTGDAFGSNLKGAVLFAQFSSGDNVRVINVDPVTGRVTGDDVLRRPGGSIIDDYLDPLDIIENPLTGQLYLMTLNRGNGNSQIILLNPAPGGVVGDITADEGNDLALTVIDGTNEGAVVFAVTGLDDDIETIRVAFDGGAAQTVTLNAQGRFTFDLTGRSGAVTAVLSVQDEVPNTATATTSFTLGEPSESITIDAIQFTVLSALTGTAETVIRRLDDPATFEANSGPNTNDTNSDGLNDGHDGISYLDPNGGAEDKASFDVTVDAPGTYTLVFRAAANNDRSVAIKTGDQSVTIDVNTGNFTTWADFPIVLTLEQGLNTIVIEQTTGAGPNIDSVTITPLNVTVPDISADEDGNLAIALLDATDPSAAIFQVTGADDDIQGYAVSIDGGPAQAVTPDASGQFTLDISGSAGAVTVTLTVSDEVPNTADAGTTVNLGGTPNDGTTLIGGVAYVLYEAENATLDGADIIGDDVGEDGRTAQNGAFVDFIGTADQTISWTVEVAEDGRYGVDILYALGLSGGVPKAARPMSLSVDGVVVDTLDFASNSNSDETQWGPQSTDLVLTAGVHTIAVTAPGANGPNVDQLRITQLPLPEVADETADENGDLAITLTDATNRTATVFSVAGLDADIETLTVSFDGGATSQPVTLTNGTFTADTSGLSGDITVTLTAQDEVPNTATATTGITLASVVTNDGTAEVDGVTFVIYEAENANLGGDPDIVLAADDDRGQSGGAFVDATTPGDDTITWTVEVAEAGSYRVDILYALATGKDPRPMPLSLDGSVIETLAFPANSNTAEDQWGPATTTLSLSAGVHTLTVTAPGGNGPNIDYLRITQAPVAPPEPGDPDADIEIQSLDPAFYANRLHFSWIDNPAVGETSDRDFKENAFVEISNSGTNPLEFRSATLTGPFDLADETVFDNLVLAAGEKITVEVLFDRSEYTSGPSSVTGVFKGALTLRTNDEDTPVATVDLAGFWQARNEGGQEPNVNEVWEVFGFGNFIEGLSLNGGGESSVLDFYDLYLPADETEVLSPYWRIADGVTDAKITQIASYNGSANAPIRIHAPDNKGQGVTLTNWSGAQNQTLLPLEGNGDFATELFNRGRIPDGWTGNDIFGITMAGLSTDPTLNGSGTGDVSQAELTARYPGYTVTGTGDNKTVFDPAGNVVPEGYTVRMYQAVDKDGNTIANTFLGIMDYTGINYDYNDNMFIIEGVEAVGNGALFAVDGLDDAAADDRLVFTNIDNPANGNQVFRNVATFEIDNDGTGPLTIQSLNVTGDFTVTGIAVGTSIAAGNSATVTVEFTGTDGVNNNAAVLLNGGLTIGTNVGTKSIALAGLAQFESENGEEPSVAQIVEAFGYSTDVAQNQLANGGRVETIGDEVLMPYMERLDGSKPVEIIQIAAFLNQGNVARLSAHSLDSSELSELFAADDNQGQTILPDGLVGGAGDTGGVARNVINSDAPFGLKVTVDGRDTYASWTDPEANRIDPDFGQLVADDRGHLIRFFQAKDGAGNVIEGTFIAIQDYPGAGNYDYNDHMFVIKNVQEHVLTAAEDANTNGVNDALETDADNDGTVAFFDPDDTPDTALNRGDYVVGFNVGGPAVASQQGLGGVALRADNDPLISYSGDGATRAPGFDGPTNPNGANAGPGAFQSYRDGTDWSTTVSGLADGEYVVVLHTQETYFNAAGQRIFDLKINGVTVADNLDPFAEAGGDTNVPVEALVQVSGGSFTIALDTVGGDGLNNAPLNAVTIYQSGDNPGGGLAGANSTPTTTGIADAGANEGTAFNLDVAGAFADADAGDTLTFTATGLPSGLSISAAGVITGTLPQVAADTAATVTVTASDGTASVNSTFTLNIADVPAPAGQTPFPGPDAPVVDGAPLTVDASNYDNGGQGVAYNDAPGLQGGSNGGRTGSAVEQTTGGDIGWIASGEWLEYTVDLAAAGTYDLDLLLATSGTGRSVTVDVYLPGAATPYATTGTIASGSTGSYTNFVERSVDGLSLQAGEQIVRVTFAGGSQDFRSFTLTQQAAPNQAPVAVQLADPTVNEGASFILDASVAFSDPDGDTLSYSISGLDGLSISSSGVISGTLPQVTADTDFDITVTASDGDLSASETFTLTVADVPVANPQTPFPAGGAPTIGANAVFIDAGTFDNGGQGISWNDDPGLLGGAQAQRGTTDVELVGSQQDIGYVLAGEWVEYTVNVAETGTYDLTVNAKTPIGGNTVTVSLEGGTPLATFALADSNGGSNSFSGTTFAETAAQQVQLEAGLNTLRVAFDGSPASNGYLLDYRGLTLDQLAVVENDAIGQSGKVTVSQTGPSQWHSVTFDQALDTPSVVMGPITNNDGSAAVTRVRNVTDTGFEFQIDEWDYLDGVHGAETVSWLALETGTHTINGQTVVAGNGTATGNDSALGFGTSFGSAPVVLAQVTSTNDARSVTAQLNTVSATGFTLDLDQQESVPISNAHGTESVSWVAVQGGGNAGGGLVSGTATGFSHLTKALPFGGSFANADAFVFLADMQTENGTDPADLRLASLSTNSASLFVQEDQSKDSEVFHAQETVGFVAIESGLLYDDGSLF